MKRKIARFIIEYVKENAIGNGFQYAVSYDIVAKEFDINLRRKEVDIIEKELELCEEVADVEIDDYGFDVVLYTDYAPNYEGDDDFETR